MHPNLTILKNSDRAKFNEAYHNLVSNYKYFSSLYSPMNLSYYRQISLDNGWNINDKSFIIFFEGKPFFGFLGALLTKNNESKISAFELPAVFLESRIISRGQKKIIQAKVRNIIDEAKFSKSSFTDYLYKGNMSTATESLLQYDHCRYNLLFSRYIDLTISEKEIWSSIRKSYCSLINNGSRDLTLKIYSSDNISWNVIEEFRRLHIKVSGRETRTLASWENQFKSIKAGETFCVSGYLESELVTAGLFTYYSGHCYYGVSASRRDMFDRPLFHALLWKAIQHAKAIGLNTFETGIDYPSDNFLVSKNISNKEKSIASFKRGYGGKIQPRISFELNGL
tara:strand:- start:143 stop:1159 length:1017 start_codon:yes stop_codon:yes gene_type:complete